MLFFPFFYNSAKVTFLSQEHFQGIQITSKLKYSDFPSFFGDFSTFSTAKNKQC